MKWKAAPGGFRLGETATGRVASMKIPFVMPAGKIRDMLLFDGDQELPGEGCRHGEASAIIIANTRKQPVPVVEPALE